MSIFKSLINKSSNQEAGFNVVAVFANQCELIDRVSHLPSSAHVLDLNCCSVLAVTIIVAPRRVDSIHRIIQATRADLPIPRPDATASLNISGKSITSFLRMWLPMSRKISSCHLRGPVKSSRGVPSCPHANMYLTKFNGESLMFNDHISVISSSSCFGVYFIKKN